MRDRRLLFEIKFRRVAAQSSRYVQSIAIIHLDNITGPIDRASGRFDMRPISSPSTYRFIGKIKSDCGTLWRELSTSTLFFCY